MLSDVRRRMIRRRTRGIRLNAPYGAPCFLTGEWEDEGAPLWMS